MKIILLLISLIILLNGKSNDYNHLKNEESPYLLQHAKNPVNWYPWGKMALQLAKKENKLIFLSIGYSTCHWCHVMNKESFENNEIAQKINQNYIAIKIDREELPHLDTAFQEMLSKVSKRRNGWPLNAILTPNQELIFITTYIPPTFKYGVEGMNTLIPRIAKRYYNNDPILLKEIASNNSKLNEKKVIASKNIKVLEAEFISLMQKRFDPIYKGFDRNPKFPLASHLNLLLDISILNKNKQLQTMVTDSLEAMSYGGIFDQIEGGFFRYSVYADWMIPHFEKMLYTQAELVPLYYKAYRLTNKTIFKTTIEKTIAFTNNTLRNQENLYYSAIDADSLTPKGKKQEGYYYTYSYDETIKALKKIPLRNADTIAEYLGIDEIPNFEDEKSNIHIIETKKPKHLHKAIKALKKLRDQRAFPFVDKKIITSWNALMIKSLYEIAPLNKKYLMYAEESLDALMKKLYINNTLHHQKLDYRFPTQKALLEDYVFVVDLLITAYQTTFKEEYLTQANNLHNYVLKHYYKEKSWYLEEKQQYKASLNDRYYVSPLSRLLHNSLSLANLNTNLEQLSQAKNHINELKSNISFNLDQHPEGLRALLRIQQGDIILKSKASKLLKNMQQIKTIAYPFLLLKTENTNNFLACDERSCFAYDKQLKKVIKAIRK